MKILRKTWCYAIAGTIVGLITVLSIHQLMDPWTLIPKDQVGVLLSQRCPSCHYMFSDMQENPSKWKGVIPVPLDKPGAGFSDQVCAATLDAITDMRVVIVKKLPRRAVCARLAAGAVAFAQREGLVATPSFFADNRLLQMGEVQSFLGFQPDYGVGRE